MSFESDLQKFKKAQQAILDKTIHAAKVELFKSIILDTPVDTGLARGNWQTTTGSPASGSLERTDPSGAQAIAEAIANMGTAQDTTYLTNNLPYIEALEYGHSQQAPNGMVRKNIARFKRIVAKAVQENKQK